MSKKRSELGTPTQLKAMVDSGQIFARLKERKKSTDLIQETMIFFYHATNP